jgi:hypothetical protein
MAKCKTQREYMFGNVTLKNATQDCKRISSKHTNPSWLGVARQSYVSDITGKNFGIIKIWR